ncbi:unnamed protein product [Linum tenue]|uniref:Cytochrome P450 n=1 Tax=Linum tenue TaxID=586396 RepID=A0AAV0PZG8_9ROSI|nr:unnamed protein product [Linum tenue]
MDFFLFLGCLLCLPFTIFHFLTRKANRTSGKLPPGPTRLPIIGNLHNLGDQPHKSLADLAQIHGPLMSLKLGQVTTIVASSPAVAKEILQKHDHALSDRYVILAARPLDHHQFGMSWLPVESKWRNLRKVCNSYIFTTQKLDSNQELRREKIEELLEGIRRNYCEGGKAVDVGEAVFRTTLNALSRTIFSLDLADEEGSETAREFKEAGRQIIEDGGKPNLGDYFPALARMDLQGIQRRVGINLGKILDLFGSVIDERLRRRRNSECYFSGNDILDTLLAIGDDNQEASMDAESLFIAGTDTTTNTLEWAMTELLRNPSILTKAKEELDKIIGKNNHLQESDISRLPYLQSILKETFRLHPAVPLLLPRQAREEVEIHGFTIPKGAQIMVNAWAIGRDPVTWNNPNSFIPERFLGLEVHAKGNNFELIPFGAGRRICPGMLLAMRMLHMILGSLIHWFDWKLPVGVEPESLDMREKFGITLEKAKPLVAIPTPR